MEIQFGEYVDKEQLKRAVNAIEHKQGATFTHKGLEVATTIFSKWFVPRPNGRRGRRFAFVITDGMSNDRRKTIEAAKQLQNHVETVVSIGIGHEVSHTELLNIASNDGSQHHVYTVENFNVLDTFLQKLNVYRKPLPM